MEMDDETFARMVAEDVKDKLTVTQRAWVRSSENRTRRHRALSELARNLDDQLAAIDSANRDELAGATDRPPAEIEALRFDQRGRRRKIERFRFFVVAALDEFDQEMRQMADVERTRQRADQANSEEPTGTDLVAAIETVGQVVPCDPPSQPARAIRRGRWVEWLDQARAHESQWCLIPNRFTRSTASQIASDLRNNDHRDVETIRVRGVQPGERWSAQWHTAPDDPDRYGIWVRFDGPNEEAK